MPHTDLSIPALLRARAAERGDATAYTFIDGALDGTGFAESLTWSQVYRRSLVVAEELRRCGTTGDRAAILAPKASTTSSPSSVRCRRASSRFRCQCPSSAFTTSGSPRHCRTAPRSRC